MRALRLVSRNTCAWTYQLTWHLDLNIGLPLTLSELGRLLFLFPKAQLQSVCLHTTNTFSLARWPPPPTSDTFSYLACLSITEWGAELTDSYFTIGLPQLTTLMLACCPRLTGTCLSQFPSLQTLFLSRCPVFAPGNFGHTPALHTLHISGRTQLEDTSLAQICMLHTLHLDAANQFTDGLFSTTNGMSQLTCAPFTAHVCYDTNFITTPDAAPAFTRTERAGMQPRVDGGRPCFARRG